jgi:2-polyprenyl-3-methyl-5-hydroxy-6-metoxy-1,4-benzoquinol methylase
MKDIAGKAACKICGSTKLEIFAHSAKCGECGVLLFYPYPRNDQELTAGVGRKWGEKSAISWYSKSCQKNHKNFTNMIQFALGASPKDEPMDVLDYGGGGGQFALICSSMFPSASTFVVDIDDDALLDQWKSMNRQIRFKSFDADSTKFDAIFMNDVFEHVSDPAGVLTQLSNKLKGRDSLIFIDTPKHFWVYPVARVLNKKFYTKILRGTVTEDHQQIWNRKSFELVAERAKLKVVKYTELAEFTMPPEYYLRNMGISNVVLVAAGKFFYRFATLLANNKIMAVLRPM